MGGCALSLLMYERVNRTFVEAAADYEKMLERFVYVPGVAILGTSDITNHGVEKTGSGEICTSKWRVLSLLSPYFNIDL